MNNIQGMGSMMGAGGPHRPEPLTSGQQQTIEDILSQYDPGNVSEEDAATIFQAFKDAGIRPTRELREVIEVAGFDAEDLRVKGMPEGPPPPPRMEQSNTSGINLSTLQSLQEALSEFDLTDLSEDEAESLTLMLQDLGLMSPGSVIDLQT